MLDDKWLSIPASAYPYVKELVDKVREFEDMESEMLETINTLRKEVSTLERALEQLSSLDYKSL